MRSIASLTFLAGDANSIHFDPERQRFYAHFMRSEITLQVWPSKWVPREWEIPQRRGSAEAYLWVWNLPAVYVGRRHSYWIVRIGRVAVVVRREDNAPFDGLLAKVERSGATPEEIRDIEEVLEAEYPERSRPVVKAERVLRRLFPERLKEPFLESARRTLLSQWRMAFGGEGEPLARFEEAVRLMFWNFPFFYAATCRLVPVPMPGIGTVSVDPSARCYFDPAWVSSLSPGEFAGVLYHEISHLLRLHFVRGFRLEADPERWNLACDLEINDAPSFGSEGTRLSLPEGAVRPSDFGLPEGLTAEQYYAALGSKGVRGVPGAGRGVAAGRCGSVASGRADPWELAAGRQAGGAPSGEAGDEGEFWARPTALLAAEELAQQVARAIGSTVSSGIGSVPEAWRRWAEERLASAHDWRVELARALRGAVGEASGMVDYSFRRPSRRAAAVWPAILPSLAAPHPEVAVIVDTSGSMSEDLLSQALAEVDGILRANGRCRVTVYAVDAEVQSKAHPWSAWELELIGGGGTDMRAGIAAAMQQRPRPQLIVVLTDGWTPWPERSPGVPVVVGMLRAPHVDAPEGPSWARVVRIPG